MKKIKVDKDKKKNGADAQETEEESGDAQTTEETTGEETSAASSSDGDSTKATTGGETSAASSSDGDSTKATTGGETSAASSGNGASTKATTGADDQADTSADTTPEPSPYVPPGASGDKSADEYKAEYESRMAEQNELAHIANDESRPLEERLEAYERWKANDNSWGDELRATTQRVVKANRAAYEKEFEEYTGQKPTDDPDRNAEIWQAETKRRQEASDASRAAYEKEFEEYTGQKPTDDPDRNAEIWQAETKRRQEASADYDAQIADLEARGYVPDPDNPGKWGLERGSRQGENRGPDRQILRWRDHPGGVAGQPGPA